jgi:small subunit ribosomal protein S20
MPTHKACEKHLRSSARRNSRNRTALSELRTAIKRVRQATDKPEAVAALKAACSCIDKCCKTGQIHRNNAANKKSRLSIFVNKLGAAK